MDKDRTKQFEKFYMGMAESAAQLSRATRAKVGAIAVRDGSILEFGFNGTPHGDDNACEEMVDGVLKTKDSVVHAEENVILKMARNGASTKGATMYCNIACCLPCARKMRQSGFIRFVYGTPYRDNEGINSLKNAGIEVVQVLP